MAGSQLKKLRNRLKEAGFIGQTNVKTKGKKRASALPRDDREERLDEIRSEFNKFDVKKNKEHHDIGGRRVKGSEGRPSERKQVELELRKAQYEELVERKGKIGGIVDRRFGENDVNLTPEEKMIERFAHERRINSAKPSKSSLFNLDDEEEESSLLTHMGESLSFEAAAEQEDDYQNDTQSDSESHPKSKHEIMQEVMAKSKKYKYERQKQKEADLDEIEKLDSQFDLIRNALSDDLGRERKANDDKDDYENTIRDLALDRRTAPTEPTLTKEEIEKRYQEKMKELEAQRIARMNGMQENDDDIDDYNDNPDHLDDDHDVYANEATEFGFGLGDTEEEPLIDSDDAESGTDSGESGSDSDSDIEDILDDEGPGLVKTDMYDSLGSLDDLNYDSFKQLFKKSDINQYPAVLSGFLKSKSAKLRAVNKDILVASLAHILKLLKETLDRDLESPNLIIDSFTSAIKQIVRAYPDATMLTVRKAIADIANTIRNFTTDWTLSSYHLVLLSICGVIYPTSDHYHVIITPSNLVMTEYLTMCPFQSVSELASGLFVTQILLKYQRISKRYIPEVSQFFLRFFAALSPRIISHPLLMQASVTSLGFKGELEEPCILGIDFLSLADTPAVYSAMIKKCSELMLTAAKTWADLSSKPEFVGAWVYVVEEFQGNVPSAERFLKELDSLRRLAKMAEKERKPLTLQTHRAIPIRTLAPKFDPNYSIDRKSKNSDPQAQELSKLRYQVKQERKAALREVRKEQKFVAEQEIQSKRKRDAEYHAELNKLHRSIQTEEGAEKNKYEREKRDRKRRK
ncbi:hypothetical protein CANCADRAFT_31063 [Tortispora caseinolytica NRRL Y-17796]|uniref:Nop14-like protein n=1 Tax=Tortispora caseinolytica NRRL Y-17796 TaxID=767744 RepID=A0A1E4TDX6_9ASCO|nr:hypothetical protein CANCADRAFT_31063 [Tortispora caseinolytica NRRL Y-17796]